MTKEKTIYTLGLHEGIEIGKYSFVERVAGGWIYHHTYPEGANATFVPYNEEFKT